MGHQPQVQRHPAAVAVHRPQRQGLRDRPKPAAFRRRSSSSREEASKKSTTSRPRAASGWQPNSSAKAWFTSVMRPSASAWNKTSELLAHRIPSGDVRGGMVAQFLLRSQDFGSRADSKQRLSDARPASKKRPSRPRPPVDAVLRVRGVARLGGYNCRRTFTEPP